MTIKTEYSIEDLMILVAKDNKIPVGDYHTNFSVKGNKYLFTFEKKDVLVGEGVA